MKDIQAASNDTLEFQDLDLTLVGSEYFNSSASYSQMAVTKSGQADVDTGDFVLGIFAEPDCSDSARSGSVSTASFNEAGSCARLPSAIRSFSISKASGGSSSDPQGNSTGQIGVALSASMGVLTVMAFSCLM
ncbi:hypothetical protein Slin15195_G057620 [Septoria linicola]|uniref:Uncharacterized protein n=1 Tax=Septoria linicola TaxID=215465 RepID=A0A9Q9EKJ2_9PEZI|nr:hypothetical protein Slin14017_G073470 [Septoria linicola]USW52443.1 hypothetical protein Slin15195_G057620 [Septoria linicola]